jgi:integrase
MAQVKVRIKSCKGSLQLVFTYLGKRNYFSPGYKDDNTGRQYAQILASRIEEDILKDRYVGLGTYRPKPSIEDKAIQEPNKEQYSLLTLWQLYLDYIRPQRSQTTMGGQFRDYTRSIQRCPFTLDEPGKIREWAVANHTADRARRLMVALNAFGKWAVLSEYLKSNPFENLKVKKVKNDRGNEIKAFTAQERDSILDAIKRNYKWRHYYRLVAFLFATGCRPSEAIALEWAHVSLKDKSIKFQQAATFNELGQLAIKQGLKSQKSRRIPLNSKVIEILGEPGAGLVFPSLKGLVIDMHNFSSRVWKPVLEEIGLEHRNVYQCRHTFITLALAKGVGVKDVAFLVGNSAEVIYKSYAATSRVPELPEI